MVRTKTDSASEASGGKQDPQPRHGASLRAITGGEAAGVAVVGIVAVCAGGLFSGLESSTMLGDMIAA